MKIFFLRNCVLAFLALFSIESFGQIPTLSIVNDYGDDLCPGEEYHFSVNYYGASGNWSGFEWKVTSNGTLINYVPGSTAISVVWNNTSDTRGSITVSAIYGEGSSSYTKTATAYFNIKTLTGQKVTDLNGDNPVEFDASSETYSVPVMPFPNIKLPNGLLEYRADSYKWLFPKGWSYKGVISDGIKPFETSDNGITVIPHSTNGGTLTVWGHSKCGGGYDSDPESFTIARKLPASIKISGSAAGRLQGDKSDITFSVPSWPGVVTYSWTIPSGWQFKGSSSGASVTLIPNGCTGGVLMCTITKLDTKETRTTLPTKIADFLPYASGNSPIMNGQTTVCSTGATFNLTNLSSKTSSLNWTIDNSVLSIVSGQNTSSLAVKSLDSGSSVITANVSVAGCASFPITKTVWSGIPKMPSSISGFIPGKRLFGGLDYDLYPYYNYNIASGFSNYTWTISSTAGSIIDGQGTNHITIHLNEMAVSNYDKLFAVTVKTTNQCGTSPAFSQSAYVRGGTGPAQIIVKLDSTTYQRDTNGGINVIPAISDNPVVAITQGDIKDGDFSFSISPNPVISDILISNTNQSDILKELKSIRITDLSGATVLYKEFGRDTFNTTLNVSDLPSGMYIVKINDSESYKIVKK
jgi:hypothetical protein